MAGMREMGGVKREKQLTCRRGSPAPTVWITDGDCLNHGLTRINGFTRIKCKKPPKPHVAEGIEEGLAEARIKNGLADCTENIV